MKKNNCLNCWNACGSYCTRQLDMKKAQYSKCHGWKPVPPKPPKKPVVAVKKRVGAVLDDERFDSDFVKFLRGGGHYSFRHNDHIIR